MMPHLKMSGICALVVGVVFVVVYLAASADVLAGRKKGGGGFSRSGPASSGMVHSGNRGKQRDARKADNRRDARRADKRRDAREDFREDRRKRRAFRALTRVAFRALSCRPRSVIVVTSGIPYTYYSCGSTWYWQAYQGTQVVYVVVVAPPGY